MTAMDNGLKKPEMRNAPYQFRGAFYEACDCYAFCPCWIGNSPDEDECTGAVAWDIEEGSIDGVDVTGRRAVSVSSHVGPRAQARQRVMMYVDVGATPEQSELLIEALTGNLGGPLGELAELLGEFIGSEQAEIQFGREGRNTSLTVGRLVEVQGTTVEGPTGRSMTLHDGKLSTVLGTPVEIGESQRFRIDVPGHAWDLHGRSTASGRFSYFHIP
jgi:hypothetical protein